MKLDIKALFLDVDGVLTDGKIIYNEKGEEIKHFNVHDGLGIKLAMRAGIDIVIISGRKSAVTDYRAAELGIKAYTGILDKATLYSQLRDERGLDDSQCAAIGDDINDLGILRLVGLSATVADAPEYVKQTVDLITHAKGGEGAVRELIEYILKKCGHWESIIKSY
jgi:3-deoxy-D-manno-octulosonate 8-phosphate phosphatase (KDO 8-P phosphatase)